MFKNSNFTVIDLEATGPISDSNHIIDIGIVRIEKGKIVQTYESLVRSPTPIPPSITRLTGIRDEDLVGAPLFKDVVDEILHLFEDAIFVGHNVNFDYGFLNLELMRLGKPLITPYLCTKDLTHKLLPDLPKLGLDALMEHFEINAEERHRALPDAELTAKILLKLTKMKGIEQALQESVVPVEKNPIQSTEKDFVKALPETAGVYYFYDCQDRLIYLSAAANVRSSAMIHFVSQIESKKEAELCNKVARVEVKRHSNLLEAKIHGAKEIRKSKPLFNRYLKRWYPGCYLWVTGEEYPQLLVEDEESHEKGVKCLGPYTSRKLLTSLIEHAKAAFGLCDFRTGRQRRPRRFPGKNTCAGVALKRCSGACVGKVKPTGYEKQVSKALEFLKTALKENCLDDGEFKRMLNDRKTEKLTGSWKFRRTIKKLLKDRQLLPDLKNRPYLFEEIEDSSGEKLIYLINKGLLGATWRIDSTIEEETILEEAKKTLEKADAAQSKEDGVLERLVIEGYLSSTRGYRRKINLNWLESKG